MAVENRVVGLKNTRVLLHKYSYWQA